MRIVAIALATIGAGTAFLVLVNAMSIPVALYLVLLKGYSSPDLFASGADQIFGVCFNLLAVVGSVTAGVYIGDGIEHARALTTAGVPPKDLTGHVVVVGLVLQPGFATSGWVESFAGCGDG